MFSNCTINDLNEELEKILFENRKNQLNETEKENICLKLWKIDINANNLRDLLKFSKIEKIAEIDLIKNLEMQIHEIYKNKKSIIVEIKIDQKQKVFILIYLKINKIKIRTN